MILGKLPYELILKISSHLTLMDKLILITTCWQLFDLISKTTLFSELNLLSRDENVEQILEKFTGSRYPGSQVKNLSISITKLPDQLLLQLPAVFPNITRFRTQKTWNDGMTSRAGVFTETVLRWSNILEMYDFAYDWPEILPVLKITTFPRLTELVLGYSFNREDKKEGFDIPYFLPHIKNAPALKKLTLTDCAVDLDLLEQIHANCPHLKLLKLHSTPIIIKKDRLFQPIIPADSLVYLKIEQAFCFDRNGLFLDYITSKYRYLKKLDLSFGMEYDQFPFDGYYNKIDIGVHNDVDSDGDEDSIQLPEVQEYVGIDRSLKKDFEETLATYRQSGSRFFLNLSTTVKSIVIENDIFDQTMEIIASSDVKIVNFGYYNLLETPSQMQCISHMKSLETLFIMLNFPKQINVPVFPSSSITNLSLFNWGEPVYFDWIFLTFPSLEQVEIEGDQNWTTSDNNSASMLPNLWKFTANVNSLDQKCFDFLVRNAPNIKEIVVFGRLSPTTHDLHIDISRWELKRLNVRFRDMDFQDSYYYHIKTPYLDEVIRYTHLQNSVALVKNRFYSFYNEEPSMINIISGDNKHFMFYDCKISLTFRKIKLLSSN